MQPECVTGAPGWASRQSYSLRRPLALIGAQTTTALSHDATRRDARCPRSFPGL